jgi:adenylate kinase family enzyme
LCIIISSLERMDACQTYVSMLQARRAEEDASRSTRKQRRANLVATCIDGFKKKSVAARRRVMDEKLHNMVSSKEQEVFSMLSDQTKWRHVMQENIVNREQQHADAAKLHATLQETELDLKREQEQRLFMDIIRDDKTRFAQALTEKKSEQKRQTEELCRDVVEDIVRAVDGVASFVEQFDLRGTGEKAPPTIVADFVRAASFPQNAAQGFERLVERHVTGELYNDRLGKDGVSLLFVSLVRKLLLLQYPKPPSFKPLNPSPKPVVVLAGAKYSGKTFVGKAIAESLGLVIVSDRELVTAAIQEFERDLTTADFSNAESIELLDLGREVRQALLDGASVSPALLSKLVLHKLKFLPDHATGILLDGLPASVEGFEKLEEALSGYDKCRTATVPDLLLAPLLEGVNPDDPLLNVERVETTVAPEIAASVVKKEAAKPKGKKGKDEHEEPLPPIDLPVVDPIPPLTEEEEDAIARSTADVDESAIHAVIHLQCHADEIFKRFAGLRVDSETGRVYHVLHDPPPKDRLPFLVSKDRTEGLTAKLHEAVGHHDSMWAECVQWLSRYDNVLYEVNATNSDTSAVVAKVTDLVNSAKERASLYYYRHQLAKEAVARQEEFRRLYDERMANRDAVRRQLAAIYVERGVDVLPPELMEPPKEVAADSLVLPVPSQLPSLFIGCMEAFQSHYSRNVSRSHMQLSQLVQQLYAHGNSCSAAVDGLWCQQDTKQKILDTFVDEFNTMIPALRRDPQGKDELHLRIDTLCEALHAVVDRRREECNHLIDALNHRTTFTDSWTECVRAVGTMLVQTEAERFLLVKQLAVLYFSAIRGEPVQIEDHLDLDIVPTVKPVVVEVVTADAKAAGGKDKKPPPKKGQRVDESSEKAAEDIFMPAVERCLAGMRGIVERMMPAVAQINVKGPAKDAKKGAQDTAPSESQNVLLAAAPLLQAEVECAKRRISMIVHFINDFVSRGIDHNSNVRKKLIADLRQAQIRQMRAVNSAIFDLRCAVEEERPVLFRLVLGLDTFAVDTSVVLATTVNAVLSGTPFAGISPPPVKDVRLLPTLTQHRMTALVKSLKAVAPDYVLYREDFLQLVRLADYQCAGPTVAPLETVFSRFDSQSCGAIDWRELVVHILLWCEPTAPTQFGDMAASQEGGFGIDGPSLVQLFEFRADIGSDPLRHDDFIDLPFFFESTMSEDRLQAYLEVLWETFSVGDTLDPNVLVLFLCADEQPLRGLQKAFAMGAPAGDESCAVTLDAMFSIFHVKANASSKMQMIDPYSRETLQSLFSAAQTLSFQDVCQLHVGRVLLNSSDMFQRKTFM